MFKIARLATATALLLAGAANAAIVFSDNFDMEIQQTNGVPSKWTVTSGTVDIVGDTIFNPFPSNGVYLDMDGSSFPAQAGTIDTRLDLVAGTPYLLTFDLAGNQRNDAKEQVNVSFGSAFATYSLGQSDPFTTFSLSFTPTFSDTYGLIFAGLGGDNVGMLLDNVTVTAVPEPQTYALMALGLMAVGAAARRRQR